MSGLENAELTWPEGGRAPRSIRFDDIYFTDDGLAESRTVFLQGCGLPEAWAGRRRFVVAELGFGTGLNVLALLHLWRASRPMGGVIHVFSVDAHPLTRDDAARALAAFPELKDLAELLLKQWPSAARRFHRIDFPDIAAVLDVATTEVTEALQDWDGCADAWFLDGFAPSRNPEMWRDEVLELVSRRSAPGARLATFTVAGAVRRGLEQRGFATDKAAGHGRKRERLQAVFRRRADIQSEPARVVVVGGGVAGASLVRAFSREGVRPLLIDPRPAGGASGNPGALVSPRLDVGEGPPARLYAQAFARAVRLYDSEAPDAVIARGALRLARTEKDVARFEKLARSELFSPEELRLLDAPDASAALGEASGPALLINAALTLNPSRLLSDWLEHADHLPGPVARLDRGGDAWRLIGDHGGVLAEAEVVCLAPGVGARAFGVNVEPVHGQASWTAEAELPGSPASWGGYAVPLRGGGVLFGATHERGRDEPIATPEGDERNLTSLGAALPGLAAALRASPLSSRASVRAATPDRNPSAGRLGTESGLYVLTGLGGRGFTTAPLLAEHVAAIALGAPSPLPRSLSRVVDPGRFAHTGAAAP